MKPGIQLPKKRIIRNNDAPYGSNLFSIEEFKALVKYERLRSDRNGSVFSVTTFSSKQENATSQKELIKYISKFSRSIDCVACGENGQIVVLLPDTAKPGAEIFGKKVLGELEMVKKNGIDFLVYSYPENWLYAEDDPTSLRIDQVKEHKSSKSNIELLFVEKIPAWKRPLDVLGSSLIMIVASPIFLMLALYIKIVSPGPVFFKSTRIGYKGLPFTFWKFRTMHHGNNQGFHGDHAQSFIKSGDIPMEKLDVRDPRIIMGGRTIRKSCIDELPQLWNILKGDMSLVGPRPCIPYEAKEYLRWHTHRFDVLPGLSGLWQISGKNKLTFKQMVRLDILYCQNISLLGDLSIILRTPFAILKMMFEAFLNKYRGEKEITLSVSMPNISKSVTQ